MDRKHFVGILFGFTCLLVAYLGLSYSDFVVVDSIFSRDQQDEEFGLLLDARARNADVYGWVKVEGTKINYPVVQHDVNDRFYLHHDIDKKSTIYGAIFTERFNSKSFDDPFVVIYGHSMLDGSMFGSLHSFKNKDFF